MKVIFLDFDLTINLFNGQFPFDPFCVHSLNEIIKNSGAKIVISSTWRLQRSIENLQELLNMSGVIGEVVGKTQEYETVQEGNYFWTLGVKTREQEINSYLEQHPEIKQYIIFDDDQTILHMKNAIWMRYPLNDTNIKQALEILNEQNQNDKI